jgi:hypothetical protein
MYLDMTYLFCISVLFWIFVCFQLTSSISRGWQALYGFYERIINYYYYYYCCCKMPPVRNEINLCGILGVQNFMAPCCLNRWNLLCVHFITWVPLVFSNQLKLYFETVTAIFWRVNLVGSTSRTVGAVLAASCVQPSRQWPVVCGREAGMLWGQPAASITLRDVMHKKCAVNRDCLWAVTNFVLLFCRQAVLMFSRFEKIPVVASRS